MKQKNCKSKVISAVVIIGFLILLATMFFSMPIQSEQSAFAEEPSEKYFIDGEETETLYLERGHFATIEVWSDGEKYIPTITPGTEEFALSVDGNRISLAEDSIVGGCVALYLSIEKGDETKNLSKPILLYPILEKTFVVVHEMTEDGYRVDGNFEKVLLRIKGRGKTIDAEVGPGEGIKEYLEKENIHSYRNLEIKVLRLTLSGKDGTGVGKEFSNEEYDEDAYETDTRMSGLGTVLFPYKVANSSDFEIIHNYDDPDTTIYFKQTTDFTVSGYVSFTYQTFYGNYNGNYKTLTRTGTVNPAGFCRTNYGMIRNLTIDLDEVVFNYLFMGGCVVYNYGSIVNVTVTSQDEAQINPSFAFGGIAAANQADGLINYCNLGLSLYVNNNSTTNVIGGICATNSGTVSNSTINYFWVRFNNYTNIQVGGLVGTNSATGVVSNVIFGNTNSVYLMLLIFNNGDPDTIPNYFPKVALGIAENFAPSTNYSSLSFNNNIGFAVSSNFSFWDDCSTSGINSTYIHKVVGKNSYTP